MKRISFLLLVACSLLAACGNNEAESSHHDSANTLVDTFPAGAADSIRLHAAGDSTVDSLKH